MGSITRDKAEKTNNKTILPLSSIKKTNKYLKEIASVFDIHNNITFHFATHPFATTVMLSNSVPVETVSKLLGHNKLSTTQILYQVPRIKDKRGHRQSADTV